MKFKSVIFAGMLAFGASSVAHAGAKINIPVVQDAAVSVDGSAGVVTWNEGYSYVGTYNPGFISVFGFDTSGYAGKTYRVSFSAYHNYSESYPVDPGQVGASIGSDNAWDAATLSSYNSLGVALSTRNQDTRTVGRYQTWNLGTQTLGSYLTVGLTPLTSGWNVYAAVAVHPDQGAFLTLSAVPEPASWALMIVGFGVVAGAMRQRKVRYTFG